MQRDLDLLLATLGGIGGCPDPADQIIVATSRVLGVLLVTLDKRIRAYTHVRTASAGAA